MATDSGVEDASGSSAEERDVASSPMGRRPLSAEEMEAFRSRLVEVAIGLFAEHGHRSVSVRQIAREMDCSPMTPYRYFEDRAEILAAVRDCCFGHMADMQDDGLARATTPIGAVRALFRASIDFSIERPSEYRIMFGLDQAPPGRPDHLLEGERRVWHNVRGCVADAVESGDLVGDPVTLAHLFMVSTHGLMTMNLAGRLDVGRKIDDLVEPLLEALIAGCSPS